MFYSQLFVSKRGTLAKIWLAAHWEKKITKAHVFECDLEASIRDILSPQIKIGLRTSGHLLLGVVRIYSKKTRYLLTDCNDALVKIKVAFRPGQTDLPYDGMEATLKTITLAEDFTDFDTQLPDLNTIDVADHFSLNQCRTEDITLKENFVNHFLTMEGIGEDIQSYQGMFDQSFSVQGDCFGDEEMAVDLIDFIASNTEDALMPGFYKDTPELPATPPPTAVSAEEPESVKPESSCSKGRSSPDMTETTFLVNAEEGFALPPVAVTPSSTRKRMTRKRKLVIDRSKELSDDAIRDQLADYSDLLTPLEIAPPTQQLMEWRASGGVKQLFSSFCLPLFHPDLKQLFPCDMPPRRRGLKGGARQQADPEVMRGQTRDAAWEKTAVPGLEDWSLLQESVVPDQTEDANTTVIHPDAPPSWNITSEEESRLEVSYPEPVSDFSMFDHPSVETRKTPLVTQSALNSQDVEDKRLTSRANNLLQALKAQDSSPNAVYSLHALCESSSRPYVAAMFFCLLVLKKQQILELHQSVPYSDITATPGPHFPFL